MIGWFGSIFFAIATFFAVGTLGFWALTAAFLAGVVILTENIKPGWAALVAAGWLWFYAATGLFNVLRFAHDYPWYMTIIVASYLFLGVFWGYGKWISYVNKTHGPYNDKKRGWLRDKGIAGSSVPEEMKEEWTNYIQNSFSRYDRVLTAVPLALDNKERIITWGMFWPWSLGWFFINDPVRRFFNGAFNRLHDLYQATADKMYADVKSEVLSKDQMAERKRLRTEAEIQAQAEEEAAKRANDIKSKKRLPILPGDPTDPFNEVGSEYLSK